VWLKQPSPAEPSILGFVDDGHPGAPELLEQAMMGNRLAGDGNARSGPPVLMAGKPWKCRSRRIGVLVAPVAHPLLAGEMAHGGTG